MRALKIHLSARVFGGDVTLVIYDLVYQGGISLSHSLPALFFGP